MLRVKIGAWGYESLISSLKSHPSRLVVLIMSDATVVIRRRNGSITAGIMAHDECDFRVRSWGRIDDFVDAIRAIGPGCHARTGWGRTAHLIKDGSADVVGFAEFTKQQNLPPLVIAEINRHKRG
ncbi:hypothetical protein HGA91_02150 [candidate division WWE3 bacterium]|nr:hypothetical protein [candidate division WWE3 bacterium]